MARAAKPAPPLKKRGRGRPPKLTPEEAEQLAAIPGEQPSIGITDIIAVFRKRTGITVSEQTVKKYLRAAGVVRTGYRGAPGAQGGEQRAAVAAAEAGEPKPRYGYNDSHRDDGDEVRYPCGLTDAEWEVVRDLFDSPGPGRPHKYERRRMLDTCIYVLRSGCAWRMMPKEFPPWNQVYKTFRRWTAQGLFEQMYDRLRELWRRHEGRQVAPTGAVLDSQSVKTSPQGGPKGYDAGKKIKGRKRHLVTDTLGLLLAVLLTTANVQDRDAANPAIALAKAKYSTLAKVYVDGGYSGKTVRAAALEHDVDIEVVRHPANRNVGRWQHPDQLALPGVPPPQRGFVLLPKRWVVERNNAWNERPRRQNRDHDRLLEVSTAWIWLTEARMLLRRCVTIV